MKFLHIILYESSICQVSQTDPGIEKEIEVDSHLDEFFLESGDPSILVTHILRSHAGLENPIYPNRRDILVP